MENKVIGAVLLLLPAALLGYGYPASYGYGSALPGLDALSSGTGGVSSLDLGGSPVLRNPSTLAFLDGARLQTGVGTVLSKETVETPYGRFNLSSIALGPASFTASFPLLEGIGVGAGIGRLSDFSYTGEYILVSPGVSPLPDTLKVFEQLEVSGSMWEAAGGVGVRILEGLSAGVSAGYRFGSGTWDYYYDNIHESPEFPPDTAYVETWDESGLAYRAGLSGVLRRVRLGAVYTNSLGEKFPARASFGLCVGDMNAGEPAVGGEVELLFPDDDTQPATLRLFGGTPLSGESLYGRASVFLFSSQGTNTREGIGMSLGMSLRVSRAFTFDAAMAWMRESREGDVFGGYWQESTVTDTHTGLTAGFTWKP